MSLEAPSPPRLRFFPVNVGEASPESTFSMLNKVSRLSVECGEAGSRCVEAAIGRVSPVVFSCEVVGSFEGDAIRKKKIEEAWKIAGRKERRQES